MGALGALKERLYAAMRGPSRLARAGWHRVRHARWKRRLAAVTRVNRAFVAQHGLTVLGGPFAGMAFVPRADEGVLLPQLIGAYEAELHAVLGRVLRAGYTTVINVGCAEGYYAVGLARRLPGARILAFDLDPGAQRRCAELARRNGVADRVTVSGACDVDRLGQLLPAGAFLLVDCEGCEKELLRPERLPTLRRCDLLVELHDFLDRTITSTIVSRFAATHDITLIRGTGREPAHYPVLASLAPRDRRRALDELRPERMTWAFITRKRAPGGRSGGLPSIR